MSTLTDYVTIEGLANSERLRDAAPRLFNALMTLSAVMACDSDLEARETAKQLGIENDGLFSELWREIHSIVEDAIGRGPDDANRSVMWDLGV